MKHINKLLSAIIAFALLVSCADEFKSDFTTDKPEDIARYEYLNAYDALKAYVNRTANPNFKLGSGITVSDFLKKELVYSLACANFDELTAGNAMKYSSCVANDGTMDFSQVIQFVDAAQKAGLSIYGHTLCWHAQQNNTYLNKLIEPTVVPGQTGDAGYCLILENETAQANNWASQVWAQLDAPLVSGKLHTLTFMAKATEACSPEIFLQSSTVGDQEYPGSLSIGTEWTEVNFTFTPTSGQLDKITFNFGKFATKMYIDNVKLTADNPSVNLISNGDFESGDVNGWKSWTPSLFRVSEEGEGYSSGQASGPRWEVLTAQDFEGDDKSNYSYNQSAVVSFTPAGGGKDGVGRAFKITNAEVKANDYDCQLFVTFPRVVTEGEKVRLTMDIKSDDNASYSTQAHVVPTQYKHWDFFGTLSSTPQWATYTKEIIVSSSQADCNTIAFNLGKTATNFYFDNIKVEVYNENPSSGGTIEKTPAEKKEILTNALDTWIKGMMEACNGYVKSWDAVNEPLSDGNTNELKSDPNHTDPDNFYWQDYLGKDYARTVIKLAREHGGDDLKLFVNDYNLEATYNNNAKCASLVKMVEYWESDGITKIDGIGTQMHVSYNMDSEKQKKQEACIVKMYELMAASGKLVKVSELDMGILDKNGDAIKTVNVTFEQQVLMSDFYKFIVEKYFEIIPVNQQYGITQWSPFDSPDADHSWRRGEPLGLWNLNYNRKPAYGGFADGFGKK